MDADAFSCDPIGDPMPNRIADELAATSDTRCLGVPEVAAFGFSPCVTALGGRSRCQ
jgi:hypothetical protein